VVIAVASPHREAAFQAARFLIDELKERLPVWKKEVYGDGQHWIGDRS
jgi:molybdopterin synthase catalytic subunit